MPYEKFVLKILWFLPEKKITIMTAFETAPPNSQVTLKYDLAVARVSDLRHHCKPLSPASLGAVDVTGSEITYLLLAASHPLTTPPGTVLVILFAKVGSGRLCAV